MVMSNGIAMPVITGGTKVINPNAPSTRDLIHWRVLCVLPVFLSLLLSPLLW
jgi:hypothetical protein